MLNEYKKRALLQLQMANSDVLERTRLFEASNEFRKQNDLNNAQQLSAQIDTFYNVPVWDIKATF